MSTPRDRLLEAFRSVDAGVEPEDIGLESEDPLLFAFRQARAGVEFGPTQFKDVGVARAFFGGVKEGFLAPLELLGREGEVLRLDETSEKVAGSLGTFVGFGLGFIPFMAGTGVVLKGIGVAKALKGVGVVATEVGERAALFNFVRNTIAGSVQFGVTTEDIKEVPKRLVEGALFGGAVEGLFLARALRGNRGFVSKAKLFDDGSPIPDVPVDIDQLAKGSQISPNINKSSREMAETLPQLINGDLTYDELLLGIVKNHDETVRLPGLTLEKADEAIALVRRDIPGAQVFKRKVQGGKTNEVLVHNPLNPEDRLTELQIRQWKNIGFYDRQPVVYDGKLHSATGVVTKEADRVQIRAMSGKFGVIEPNASEVSRPLAFTTFSQSAARNAVLTKAARSAETNIGFAVQTTTPSTLPRARRGFVDTSDYDFVSKLDDFLSEFSDELVQIEAVSTEDAKLLLARRKGIKGVVVKNDDLIEQVRVLDQSTVHFVKEPPRVIVAAQKRVVEAGEEIPEGIARLDIVPEAAADIPTVGIQIDNASVTVDESGRMILQSFVPSWKNSIIPSLRSEGIPEREIQSFLDMQLLQMTRSLEASLDDEFRAIKNASELQFGGCL